MTISERSLRVLSWVIFGLMLLSGVVSFLMDRVSGYTTDWGFAVIILAFPITSEIPTSQKPGAYNHFQNGSIYWSPSTGAHMIRGGIRVIGGGSRVFGDGTRVIGGGTRLSRT